jgi:hypothetical protein
MTLGIVFNNLKWFWVLGFRLIDTVCIVVLNVVLLNVVGPRVAAPVLGLVSIYKDSG